MKKKILSICLSVAVLVALIVVLVPGCTGGGQGTIEVKATLCDEAWEGDVQYKLTPASGSPVNGTNVTSSFNVTAGNWTCEYVSGGPAGAFLDSITPASVTVAADETKTITLNFELDQDAWINCVGWSVDGILYPQAVNIEVVPCQIIDFHFLQGVEGCEGRVVAVNETSWLKITQTGGPLGVQVLVVNDLCAVNKAAEPPAEPAEKVSQKTTLEGDFVDPGVFIPLEQHQVPVNLDVETIWQLVKETDYTKSINWFGISVFVPEPGHDCVLFELIVPGPGIYTFQLIASAEVELMDDEDVDTENNQAICAPLNLTVTVL